MATQFTLPDGRNLDAFVTGAKDGFPLIFAHGNPGAFNPVPHLADACERKGFKLITFSRPGFGGSSRLNGRKVVDVVADVRILLDHLGLERCAVGGWSAGGKLDPTQQRLQLTCTTGPHALACAARLPGCVASISVAGLAPYDGEGLTWPEGENVETIKKGEGALRQMYEAKRPAMVTATAAEMTEQTKPEVDRTALIELPGLGQYVEDTFREALKHSVDGCVDDDLAFFSPWGFNVADIRTPVFLYHGHADLSVPISHGRWLASHIPSEYVTTHFEENDGHVSIIKHVEMMLDEVSAAVHGGKRSE